MTVLSSAVGRTRVLRVRGFSVRFAPRSVVVCVALVGAALVATGLSVAVGDYPITPTGVVRAVLGFGAPGEELIVWELRLPRVVVALLVGAGLAMAGAIFQSLSRNPLGSPDVIGFDTGAASGALVAMLVFGGTPLQTSVGAVVGAAATAAVVFLLASGHGMSGMRLVLVGVGVGALLTSVNSYLITHANIYDAQSAAIWLVGSLDGRGWEQVRLLAPALLVLTVLAVRLGRELTMLELAEETIAGLGVPAVRVRAAATFLGVGLAGVAVAATGPIVFVALAAPQVARRLTLAPGPNMLASALMGAVLLTVADLGAQELFAPRQLPVGVMTGVVGGLYLAWLLTREWRKGRA